MSERFEHLTVDRSGHVATVTFNRPEKANALNPGHLADIEAVAQSFRDDTNTRVVIFTGAGKHFSAGADLTDPGERPDTVVAQRRWLRMGERAVQSVYDMDQITIAAWNGAAMGGGACLATAMDLRIGADDCVMGYPEIDIGVNLMWKSLPLITHLVGPARAKRLVVGGERVAASVLLEWGLLEVVVPRERLMDEAGEWAARYVAKPPVPAQMIKRSVNAIVSALDTAVMHMDVDQYMLTMSTGDQRAAIKAYFDKTDPTFAGD
ncbi:MAG: enoyl-CoA hydratase [Gammaproteobacteria bacterium]|nr:enoyl-CoA hydratase [Gammaproteobacteria bacterium]|tara:strand:+ start:280 stop:1071 length:792 start_codon:yes stop_codon:yes gene_type:complete